MSVRTSACLISLSILLGFILFVKGEHFYLPKENNDFSNDLQDDWVPVSGIDKRSTRVNNGFSQVVHITPPVRYTNRPLNLQPAASNKIEVFAQPPPTILGSFSEFGHATIEAREPAHTLNFRPSYNFDRHYEETNDRRFQQNDYNEPEDQKPPAIVVFNAQQRHPQNYQKPPPPQPPPQFYQNFQFHNINNNPNNYNNNPNNHNNNNNNNNHNNHKNFGFKEPPIVQDPPKKLTPYYVPNDHIFPRPQGNNKQVYAEQRPKPYLVNPSDPIQQQPQQNKQQHQHQHHHHHNHQQQQQLKQQQEQQQPYKSSTEVESSAYFQKYPGHVENQNLYPQISNFARPFEQTNGDQNVFIKPNQYVHNLNVGTEVRFGPEHGSQPTHPVTVDLSSAFTHPATRPFSKYQTPSPKNEELYRIFPVKEVNALPAFLPTPVTLGHQQPLDGRPKAPYFKDATVGGSSEYDAREEQDENESSEQYDILKSPTKPMLTSTSTTTTTTTTVAPKTTRKRKPITTTTTTTTTAVPDDYDEYAVPNRQQLQLQEHQQDYRPRQQYQQHQDYETVIVPTTEASTTYAPVREERPVPVSVNKFKKKKPLPSSRPKEPYPTVEYENVPERVTLAPTTTTTTTTAATTTAATTTTTTASQPSASDAAAADARAKIKSKYGNGTRPRFSIKDYKTSTTTTSTTAPSTEKASFTAGRRTTTTASPTPTDPETVEQPGNTTARKSYKPRARPNRYKSGTSTTTTTDEPQQQQQQDTTTERAYRSKYKPGKYYNRLRTSTDSAVVVVDEGSEPVAATEPTRPAVYSAKRRTVPTIRTAAVQPATATAAEEHNGLRRSSSVSPLDENNTSEAMDAASSEDVDYVATTVAVTPAAPRHKYHTSYTADRPLLPIESFFQSSMASKRNHNEQR